MNQEVAETHLQIIKMIQVFFDSENFFEQKKVENLLGIIKKVKTNSRKLEKIKTEDLLDLINEFSKNILKNEKTRKIEGIAFLSQWVRKTNLEKIIKINFEDPNILQDYFKKEGKMLIAQPKGLVGHWIAGNVVTLGFFSLIQSIIIKNSNIMRIPLGSVETIKDLLGVLIKTKTDKLIGKEVLSSTALIYYPREEDKTNLELSMNSDVRIIWGGKESIEMISSFSKKETCEDVVFGPKYSFAMIDRELISDEILLTSTLKKFVFDIIFGEQDSCTSPQVLMCETDITGLEKISNLLKKEFENLDEKYLKKDTTFYEAGNVIMARVENTFDEDKKVICPKGTEWTIILGKKANLEEPVKSRTIFLNSCNNLEDLGKLITSKIQTIGHGFKNTKKLTKISKILNLQGVSRIVPIGQMNYYDSPWDGKLLLSRLVNINSLKI